jgi:hypothetical protein
LTLIKTDAYLKKITNISLLTVFYSSWANIIGKNWIILYYLILFFASTFSLIIHKIQKNINIHFVKNLEPVKKYKKVLNLPKTAIKNNILSIEKLPISFSSLTSPRLSEQKFMQHSAECCWCPQAEKFQLESFCATKTLQNLLCCQQSLFGWSHVSKRHFYWLLNLISNFFIFN